MDNEIRKNNRIPGCDQLTRPEEIQELSKFLGNLRVEYNELEKDKVSSPRSFGIPGKDTGIIPKISLETELIGLEVSEDINLDNTSEKLIVDEDINLDNTSEKLIVDEDINLDNTSEKLIVDEDINLDNTSEKLIVDEDINLEEVLDRLFVDEDISLDNTSEKLIVEDELDTKEEFDILPTGNGIIIDTIEEASALVENNLTASPLPDNNSPANDDASLELEELPESVNTDAFSSTDNLIDAALAVPGLIYSNKAELDEEVRVVDSTIHQKNELDTTGLTEDSLDDYDVKGSSLPNIDQVNSLSDLVNLQVQDRTNLGRDVASMPWYKLPEVSTLNALDVNTYLRWIAENAVGNLASGGFRELLVNEALAAAVLGRNIVEDLAKAGKNRLPGDDLGGLSQLVSGGLNPTNLVNSALGVIMAEENPKVDPINRPKIDPTTKELERVEGWEGTTKRIDISNTAMQAGRINSLESGTIFKTNYLQGEGISTTLRELCQVTSLEEISSVDDLFAALKSSPYVTTPDKFTNTKTSNFKTFMLDTNSYWEMIFTPYIGELNGGKTFLPPIWEINSRNQEVHGVMTNYKDWIPFTSFDLQKSRLTTKSLNLYDGDIMFPISMDFINEFRMTVADDQYKSWKLYFEKCAQAAIYNTVASDESYQNGLEFSSSSNIYGKDFGTIPIDRKNICIAPYKNITFRCIIYVMSPQYSTIKKFDLLLVLKDFSEDASGEIESSGTDLSLAFSIVGENPDDSIPKGTVQELVEPEVEDLKVDWTSIASEASNSLIKLI